MEFASRYDACRNFHSNDLSTLAKECSATQHEINEEWRKDMNVTANKRTLCFTSTCSKNDAVDTQHTQQGLDTRQMMTDDRIITAEQLRGKVSENNNLLPQQQEDLYNVLIKFNI